MPATPLHFLAIAPLHFKRTKFFDITALLFSSTAVDLELLYLLLIGEPMYHGIWHSYFFVLTILPVAVSLFVFLMERKFLNVLTKVYTFFRFFPRKVKYSFRTIYLSSLIGGISHIFFDMWVHRFSSYVLFPFSIFEADNPFWIGRYEIMVHIGVALLGLYTVYIWIQRANNLKKKDKKGSFSDMKHL